MSRARATRNATQHAQHGAADQPMSAANVLADTMVLLTGLQSNVIKDRCIKLVPLRLNFVLFQVAHHVPHQIQQLGAQPFSGTIVPHNQPHVIVTQSWRSERLKVLCAAGNTHEVDIGHRAPPQAARTCNPNVPVVLPTWLDACKQQQDAVCHLLTTKLCLLDSHSVSAGLQLSSPGRCALPCCTHPVQLPH